jgi:Protein of unknown function (DUF3307)
MPWVEIFVVLFVSHAVGDFVLQTEWQATRKTGGLGPDPEARRALLTHVGTYTLTFVPALVWLADSLGAGVVGVALLVAGPHLIQDDGRLVQAYIHRVKRSDVAPGDLVFVMVDQAFHLVTLFAIALIAGD